MVIKKWLNETPYLMLFGLIIFFLCTHSPNVEYDIDPSYILFGAARPPLYPIFIWLFHWAGSYQFALIMWIQGVLLFSSLLYARYWLRKNLQISDFSVFLICLLIIITISLHYQIWFIQSEGLAFPLFIWIFFLLIECFYQFNIKKLFYLALLTGFLVLTRLQFYYLYGMFLLLCVWYFWQRIPIKQRVLAIVILAGSITTTTLIDHIYHYVKHGFFGSPPYASLMILVQTLYLTDSHAANYFQDTTEKKYVQEMLKQRDAQGLNKDAVLLSGLKPSYFEYAYQSYARNYLAMQDIIDNTLNASIEKKLGREINFQSNIIATDINKVLILHEPKKNLLFLIWKFVECMGGIPLFLFFLILLLTSILKMIKDNVREPNLSTLFVTIVALLTFCNAFVIALCNPDVPVYFCYSQFMFYCLAALLASKIFNRHCVGVFNAV
ncbi:MAG: hypothetical protein ACD_60C00027G0009 [uncultured bacterium]|nr:MAG: hypothetical protein ACD_60C00027G0009 [uncultured bacterium]